MSPRENFYFGNKKELEKGEQTGENIASQVPASVVAQVPEVNAHQMDESNGSKLKVLSCQSKLMRKLRQNSCVVMT